MEISLLYNKKATNILNDISIDNLYYFADDTKDNKIISFKNDVKKIIVDIML
jgi:hypothetical protein